MKVFKKILLGSIFAFSFLMMACGGSGMDTSPTPLPENDSSYKGVYKGVLTGSTGHFYIDIMNTDATKVTLVFTFDGVTKTIEGTLTMNGSNYVYTFTSTDGYTMVFEVTPTGTVVSATFTYTGHSGPIAVNVDKATSTTDVTVWEGTWNCEINCDDDITSGTWNVIIRDTVIAGYSDGCGEITGTLAGTAISVTCAENEVVATGTKGETTLSGDWEAALTTIGTFTGNRTL